MGTIELILKRVHSDTVSGTFGTLALKNKPPFCVTVEKPWLNNHPNASCIPDGRYQVKLTPSAHFDRVLPEVIDVPDRTGIRIHTANLQTELLGCIATGESFTDINGQPGVGMSREAFSELMQLIGNNDCWITIENHYGEVVVA